MLSCAGLLFTQLPAITIIVFTNQFYSKVGFLAVKIHSRDIGMDSYFCDPQAPWQKGAVESNNSRIRRFLPRETNLAALSDADLYEVCVIMNNTPRKCLGVQNTAEGVR